MLEALWSIRMVADARGFGTGVVVLETGRVLGGDSAFTYVGDFKMAGDGSGDVEARVRVRHYDGPNVTIFDLPASDFTVLFRGPAKKNRMTLRGVVEDRPDLQLTAQLERVAELP